MPVGVVLRAGDDLGNVLISTHPTGGYSAWTTVHVDSSALSISCPSASLCVAGDGNGNILTSTDPAGGAGTWRAAHVASTAIGGGGCQNGVGACHGVACPSVSLCIAIDGAGDVLSSSDPVGGAPAWKTSSINSGGYLNGVECAYGVALPGARRHESNCESAWGPDFSRQRIRMPVRRPGRLCRSATRTS